MAWGSNYSGQLGDRTTTDRLAPVPVAGLNNVIAIACGGDFGAPGMSHSLAILANGTVMAWGSNDVGQLGDGTVIERHTPTQVSGLRNIIAVAAGSRRSLALLSDGTVMAWGWNLYGQLGDGTTTYWLTSAVQVSGLANAAAIAGAWISASRASSRSSCTSRGEAKSLDRHLGTHGGA